METTKIGKGADALVNKRVAKAINLLMEKKEIRQIDLADSFSMSEGGLSRLKNGSQNATAYVLQVLCNKYGVSSEFLLTGEGEVLKMLTSA